MDYEEYMRLTHRAAQLVDAGSFEEALAVLHRLLDSDIADQDKAMMCLNIAIVHDKLGQVTDALDWYDRGARYEKVVGQIFVAESQAAYLAARGQVSESLELFQALLRQPGLGESDKERLRRNVQTLKDQLGG